YILPGLVEANESSIPVLAITTDVAVGSRGRFTLTELDQRAMFRPVTKWNAVLDRAVDIPRTVRSAFAQMTTGRPGSSHLCLPYDVQLGEVDQADLWADETFGVYPSRRVGPDPDAVRAAARLIRDCPSRLFICGGGVVISGASGSLQRLAERIGAAVATTISGQGSIGDEHPLAVGVVGSNGGTPYTRRLVDAADLVIFVGCRAGSVTTERWRHPAPGGAKVLHVDIDPVTTATNYRADVSLVGDAALVIDALLGELGDCGPHPDSRLTAAAIRRELQAKRAEFLRYAEVRDQITPERIVHEMQALLADDAVVVADAGTPCPYFSGYFDWKRPGRQFISNRAHGALGYSLSAAIGAQFGRPDKKVVAVMGDGSFGFTAGELETAVRHRLPITFVVISNASYGWIKAGQRSGFGERYFSVDFSRTDHAAVARAFGVRTWSAHAVDDLRGALSAALAHDGPTLVDVVTQPLHEAHAPVSEWVA
ncbi:MAG TPA: thiamine pyrophosphate-binding protein, partial [Burkholderiaceae bacterium]|nr:thiamine pyrophosphate-binding protein [Burkholderiaceae bacterium]